MEPKFLFITGISNDPYFNLASEEYLLKHTEGYYIYLWINAPSVIVGVNQNALQEVNLDYTSKNDVKVVRRLTGGGAVYHDFGNLCYTVIAPFDQTQDNYKKFTTPVIEYLNTLGIEATFSGRNDILVEGKKISGNAQVVHKGRIMHHGTILYDTNSGNLAKSLNPNKLKMESKGIKSVRSRVTNLKDHLPEDFTMDMFFEGLSAYLKKDYKQTFFTDEDKQAILTLVKNKYSTYEWNIGYSPKGKNKLEAKFSFGVLEVTFDTENGLIKNPMISGDFFTKKDLSTLLKKLDGVRLDKQSLKASFNDIGDYIDLATPDELIDKLLS